VREKNNLKFSWGGRYIAGEHKAGEKREAQPSLCSKLAGADRHHFVVIEKK
jgi:hypothetical protein